MPERTCSVDGCRKPSYQRGWCTTHYSRWYKTGKLDKRPKATPWPCLIEGCEKLTGVPGTARGFCSSHYQRWKVYGDPLGHPDYINKGKQCAADGCIAGAKERGLCAKHYTRSYRYRSLEHPEAWARAPAGQRWCAPCSSYKPESEFYRNRSRVDGLSTSCKACDRAKSDSWRQRNPDKVRDQALRRDPETAREAARDYRKRNPAAARLAGRTRRMRERGTRAEPFTRLEIGERDGWICQLCDEPIDRLAQWPHPRSFSVDHVRPVARGGEHTRANVQASHLRCNLKKYTREIA